MASNKEMNRMLKDIGIVDFVLVDLTQYLDTHPYDQSALNYFNHYSKIKQKMVHEFSMMMTIALRFIPTLIDETNKIMNAQKARGADLDTGSLLQRVKALVPVLIPLFISSFRRADELAMAMECRCYRGGEGRTRM